MNPRDTETQTPPDTLHARDADAPSETAMADAIAAAAIQREQPPATAGRSPSTTCRPSTATTTPCATSR